MIQTVNVSLAFGGRTLYKEVNLKFTKGNCYGIIGANGAGKSTFLKILTGEIEPNTGEVIITPGERMSVLEQNQNKYDNETVLDTVLLGHKRLMEIQKEKDAIYEKPDFTDEDGIRASELEEEYAELGGWEAESDAGRILNGLGVDTQYHYTSTCRASCGLRTSSWATRALYLSSATTATSSTTCVRTSSISTTARLRCTSATTTSGTSPASSCRSS